MFMVVQKVVRTIEKAICDREILILRYQHKDDKAIVERKMAPFDVGTTNPKTYEQNKDNAYMFCFDYKDEKTGILKPIVHAVKINLILKIIRTGEHFDENELADINMQNSSTHYDYRTCTFALLPDRDWFR